jgi:hypothetical protein
MMTCDGHVEEQRSIIDQGIVDSASRLVASRTTDAVEHLNPHRIARISYSRKPTPLGPILEFPHFLP